CAHANEEPLPMLDEAGQPTESLIEALLYPGEHSGQQFVYTSEGEEAQFCLDASLSAKDPFAQVYPERIAWPAVGGVQIEVDSLDLKLIPQRDNVTDATLDAGFAIRWYLTVKGQDFSNRPVFRLRAVAAEVFSTETAEVLFHWQKPAAPRICTNTPKDGFPHCDLTGISIESQSIAISPTGDLVAVATTGLKPGIDVYNISSTPVRIWQALFAETSGGALDVTFSADGNYIAALLGNGAIHRFDAISGGRHLMIPSSGLTATVVPPGDVVAVGGKAGELVLWRLSDGTIEWKIEPRNSRGDVDRVAVSGDGRTVATLEFTDTQTIVRVWPVKTHSRGYQFDLPGTGYEELALNKDGTILFLTHDDQGLVTLEARQNAHTKPLGQDAVQCRSALFFDAGAPGPGCSIAGGILQLTADGKTRRLLKIHSDADRWYMAESPVGTTVAVGAGHLLIWR
ncbi:MAG: WD40 repeat domain-containing protein, partial [Deltaproteobacteria bacterium]|nr:WD40 repeat domain-containing protein [Deltaproteobacteria bacterium]